MTAMEKNWILKSQGDGQKIESLSGELNIAKPLATLLVQRGITSFEAAKNFFRPQLTQLHDPFLMKDMDMAVERIQSAVQNREKILVYGDYDVDGTTSVALVYTFLKSFYEDI
ncbi:MAG: single-stranded-DNA-specific exonuclease RecJ, partial [Bacteroides sp. SM23_62]